MLYFLPLLFVWQLMLLVLRLHFLKPFLSIENHVFQNIEIFNLLMTLKDEVFAYEWWKSSYFFR